MDLPWNDLSYLEVLDRTGKVGPAARELGISVSTLYRRMAELEAQVGELCLKRSPGGATLTDFGRALAQVGRKTRSGLNDVLSQRRSRETEVEGEVSLTTIIALLPSIQTALTALSQQHPKLHVTLHLGDDGPSVRQREVDVALGIMRRPPPGCWGRKVEQFPVGVFATREAAARNPRRWLVRSLSEVTSPESAWERAHAQHLAARAPFHALVELCAAGMGLGLMPRAIAARHSHLIELREFAPKLGALERTAWLLCHPDQRRTARVVALMNAVAGAFT